MNVSSVGSSSYVSNIQAAMQADDADDVSAPDAPQPRSDISPMGGMMQQLQGLEQSDPSKFKTVMSEISDKLKTQASSATGASADRLNALADRFAQAGQSGDLSAL